MPTLATRQRIASTVQEKTELLYEQFYPSTEADLSDIRDTTFTDSTGVTPLRSECKATIEEVEQAIRQQRAGKAPGKDELPADFLKAMGRPITEAITSLLDACWNTGYYPERFREARTIVLKKPGKESYSEPKAWRPIALLSTIGKVMETVTARRIQRLAEDHQLLPSAQMGARPGRSVETALELLVGQIHEVWDTGKNIASMLSLDISGAFDTVNATRLLDVLRQRHIPMWIVRWVKAFMTDRKTTLVVQGEESANLQVNAGVPQGSPLSPILFLFYNAELLEICNASGIRTSGIGFMDDVNMLAYGSSTEGNCRQLERTHRKCIAWSKRFGLQFAPQKYELVHFTRRRNAFNLAATVDLEGLTIEPTPNARVLGVWLDTKLNWNGHLRELRRRAARQTLALTRITASTWGATFQKARTVYTAVVRPLLTYASPCWHQPGKTPAKPRGIAAKLSPIQNACLRTVAGAFKATPIKKLETETYVPPIDIYLDSRLASFRRRLIDSGQAVVIYQACASIRARLRRRRCRRRTRQASGPGARSKALNEWSDQWMKGGTTGSQAPSETPGARRIILHHWKERWRESIKPNWDQRRIDSEEPAPGRLQLYKYLRKAESSLLVQARTGCIGLSQFLRQRRVPTVPAAECRCGEGEETPKHIAINCSIENERRHLLYAGNTLDYHWLTNTPEGAKQFCKWFMETGRLQQFSLARTLLYS